MCLYTHNTVPMASDKDLVVYKMLYVELDEYKFFTPYRYMECNLGEAIKAKEELPSLPSDYSYNIIEEGVIHASISKETLGNLNDYVRNIIFVKAIIKAGTPFFVSFDFESIAAPVMQLTTKVAVRYEKEQICAELEETRKAVRDMLAKQPYMSNKDGVRVGDALLADCMTFVHAEDIKKDMEVIGVVGFIRPDGKPQVVSLDEEQYQWKIEAWSDEVEAAENICNTDNPNIDFDGYGHTKQILNLIGEKWHLPSFSYTMTYCTPGTEPHDWYLPAVGEMKQAMRNACFINETISKISSGRAKKLVLGTTYWTSSVQNNVICTVDDTTIIGVCNSRWMTSSVRPMLHLPKVLTTE